MFGLWKKLAEARREINDLKRTIGENKWELRKAWADTHIAKSRLKASQEREAALIKENEKLAYRCYQLSKELLENTGVPEKGRGTFEKACPEK